MIEIAISPIFLGCLLVPALVEIGGRFLSSLVAICLWPLAWAVCDLLTQALINIAVNPTNNPGAQAFATGAMLLDTGFCSQSGSLAVPFSALGLFSLFDGRL